MEIEDVFGEKMLQVAKTTHPFMTHSLIYRRWRCRRLETLNIHFRKWGKRRTCVPLDPMQFVPSHIVAHCIKMSRVARACERLNILFMLLLCYTVVQQSRTFIYKKKQQQPKRVKCRDTRFLPRQRCHQSVRLSIRLCHDPSVYAL